MKIFNYKKHKVSRNFLIAASAYRHMAKDRDLDFSIDSLKEQYDFESKGIGSPDPKRNGYNCGKWILDATIKMMKEDIEQGYMAKIEFKDACAFVRNAVINDSVIVKTPVFECLGGYSYS